MFRLKIQPTLVACAVAGLLSSAVAAPPLAAQIPDEFTNLKLIDKDIEKRQLIGIMRSWAGGLGVRCNHCHVGPDNLQGMDFASDEKETKRAARVMLEMSRAINRQYVGSWEKDDDSAGDEPQVVACFTCHRGQPKPPQKLTWMLAETARDQGVEAAMTQYRELKAEHYGKGLYDFSESVFGEMAQVAFETGRADDGLAILRSALEVFPESANLHAFLGMALAQSGDAEAAAGEFEKSLALDPDNASAKRGQMLLEQIKERDGG